MIRCRVCGNKVQDDWGLDQGSLAFCCRAHFRAARAVLASSSLDVEELQQTLEEGHWEGLERLYKANPVRTRQTFKELVGGLLVLNEGRSTRRLSRLRAEDA